MVEPMTSIGAHYRHHAIGHVGLHGARRAHQERVFARSRVHVVHSAIETAVAVHCQELVQKSAVIEIPTRSTAPNHLRLLFWRQRCLDPFGSSWVVSHAATLYRQVALTHGPRHAAAFASRSRGKRLGPFLQTLLGPTDGQLRMFGIATDYQQLDCPHGSRSRQVVSDVRRNAHVVALDEPSGLDHGSSSCR